MVSGQTLVAITPVKLLSKNRSVSKCECVCVCVCVCVNEERSQSQSPDLSKHHGEYKVLGKGQDCVCVCVCVCVKNIYKWCSATALFLYIVVIVFQYI